MPLLSLPVLDEAPLTVGDNPSPFGMVNRPPNNVWGDIQSDAQIIAGMEAAAPWTFDDAWGDLYGTSVNPHMPPAQGFQGLEGHPRFVEGMGFPAVDGQMLTTVGTYNNDGGYWPESYGSKALVHVEAGPYLRALMKHYKAETGKDLRIESAFRNPAHNEAVGGVPDSGHLTGRSIDIKDPEAREWVKKNGKQYGFVLADYTKEDGTKNTNHFDFGGDAVISEDFEDRRQLELRKAQGPSSYQHWDESPIDDDYRTPMDRYRFTASPEERTQWGLGDIEHMATVNPNTLVRDSRSFQFPTLEFDPDYRQSMYLWHPPSTATEKEREAFQHMSTIPKGEVSRYIPEGGDPSVIKGFPGSGWTEDTIGTEEIPAYDREWRDQFREPEWVEDREYVDPWEGARDQESSIPTILGHYAPYHRWGNEDVPLESTPYTLERRQKEMGIHSRDGADPVADQDAAIQFEDPTGTADPHGIYHYATEALKKMTPPNMTSTVRPLAYQDGMASGTLKHEALHGVFDDLVHAGAKGFSSEESPLPLYYRKALKYNNKIGGEPVEEAVAYLMDFEKSHEALGLKTSVNITVTVRKAYSDFKQGKITELDLKKTLANALAVFDLKEIVEEASASGLEYMSPEYLAKVKELSYSKIKKSMGVDPTSHHRGEDFWKAADVEHLMTQIEKKVDDFDFDGLSAQVKGLDDWDMNWYGGAWKDSLREIGAKWRDWHDVEDYGDRGFRTGQEQYF